MNPEDKERWVKALRSGKYKQGKGRLYDGRKYCCLGVLCRTEGLRSRDQEDYPGYRSFSFEGESMDTNLSFPFIRYLGITEDQANHCVTMNDADGKSFNQIADWIEENL